MAFVSTPAAADVTVTPDFLGTTSTIPGSSADFTLFGNASTYPSDGYAGGDGGQPTDLTDFTVTSAGVSQYGGNSGYSTLTAPNGTAYETGIVFSYNTTNTDLATVTLGNSTSFNYGDFNLDVLFGNVPGDGTNTRDTQLILTINGTAYTADVTDDNTSTSLGEVEQFNIQGLSSGSSIEVGATKSGNVEFLGALSFQAVPEPSTYALVALGGFAFFGLRRLRVCRS